MTEKLKTLFILNFGCLSLPIKFTIVEVNLPFLEKFIVSIDPILTPLFEVQEVVKSRHRGSSAHKVGNSHHHVPHGSGYEAEYRNDSEDFGGSEGFFPLESNKRSEDGYRGIMGCHIHNHLDVGLDHEYFLVHSQFLFPDVLDFHGD